MSKEDMEQVSFEELWAKLSGSTKFGQDELIKMLAYQDDQGKDFCISHRGRAFCVPINKIREFFIRHKKPVPPMSKAQELTYLREKVKKLETEAEQYMGEGQLAKPAPDVPEALTPAEEDVELREPSGSDGDPKNSATVEPAKAIPPKRDESIPPPEARKKMSLKEVRADLAKELKDAPLPKEKVTGSAVAKNIKGREAEVDGLLKKK